MTEWLSRASAEEVQRLAMLDESVEELRALLRNRLEARRSLKDKIRKRLRTPVDREIVSA